MAFCINCGQELAEGAKFCANCGKAVTGESTISQRKTVYEGNLHKCPNCGEVLNSFVTNCPTCGHEIHLKRVRPQNSKMIPAEDKFKAIGPYAAKRQVKIIKKSLTEKKK